MIPTCLPRLVLTWPMIAAAVVESPLAVLQKLCLDTRLWLVRAQRNRPSTDLLLPLFRSGGILLRVPQSSVLSPQSYFRILHHSLNSPIRNQPDHRHDDEQRIGNPS